MKKFIREFKEFALKGNVLNLAVGIIIGGAFQSIVSSLVKDIISPFIGLFAKTDFGNLIFTVREVEIKYGSFITNVLNFIILALVIFLLVKGMNAVTSIGKNNTAAEPTTKKCGYCKTEINISATRCPHCTSVLTDEA
jgi:large conductance mechanosensitive channel